MEISKLKLIMDVLKGTSINEVSLERGDDRIRIVLARPVVAYSSPVESPVGREQAQGKEILSRYVGIFQNARLGSETPLAKLGEEVREGSVVGVIRVMNLEHGVIAECDGKILEFLVEDGQPVEYGQPLVRLK